MTDGLKDAESESGVGEGLALVAAAARAPRDVRARAALIPRRRAPAQDGLRPA